MNIQMNIKAETNNRSDFLFVITIIFLFVILASITWNRYLSVIGETMLGYIIPLEIVQGKSLYSDIAWSYGPLSNWITSLIFKVFGCSITIYNILCLINLFIVIMLVYCISRHILSPWESALSAIMLLACFGLKKGGAFLAPVSMEYSYGHILGFITIFLLFSLTKKRSLLKYILLGACTGFAFLIKHEFAFAISSVVLIWLLSPYHKQLLKMTDISNIKVFLSVAIPSITIPLATYSYILQTASWGDLITEGVWSSNLITSRWTWHSWMGQKDNWLLLLSLALIEISIILFLLRLCIKKDNNSKVLKLLHWGIIITLLTGIIIIKLFTFNSFKTDILTLAEGGWLLPLNTIVIICFVSAFYYFYFKPGFLKQNSYFIATIFLLTTYLFFLQSRYLLTFPQNIITFSPIVIILAAIPKLIQTLSGHVIDINFFKKKYFILLSIITVFITGAYLYIFLRADTVVNLPVEQIQQNIIYEEKNVAIPFISACEYIRSHTNSGEAIIAFPSLPAFYLCSQRPNPIREMALWPGFIKNTSQQENILTNAKQNHVRYFIFEWNGAFPLPEKTHFSLFWSKIKKETRQVASFGNPQKNYILIFKFTGD